MRHYWPGAIARAVALVAFMALPSSAAAQDPHAGHQQPPAQAPTQLAQPPEQPREPIPPVTEADRIAAFPAGLNGHTTHDRRITSFVLFDQLEWQSGKGGGISIDNKTWIGGDVNRLWIRAEGESSNGRPENAQVHALFGRAVSRWWEVVAGVRHDFRPGPGQAWLAVGVQGLAPQWLEVEATAYVGRAGRTHVRLEAEYEALLTNRLILQPIVEAEIYGKSDRLRGIGAGLSAVDAGLRLRYEVRREFAPYLGLTWHRAVFGTADLARAAGEEVGRVRLALGVRTWF